MVFCPQPLAVPSITCFLRTQAEISITEETSGQICIILETTSDGLERDVSVTLTTTDGTASNFVAF